MAVPKQKTSKSKRGMRRSHDGLKTVRGHECDHCGDTKLPHQLCQACGYYKGRQVIFKQDF